MLTSELPRPQIFAAKRYTLYTDWVIKKLHKFTNSGVSPRRCGIITAMCSVFMNRTRNIWLLRRIVMRCKDVRLIVDLREGQGLPEIANMNAVLAAAGWKMSIALKEYGGESLKLAEKAVKAGVAMVLFSGGDGTLNQVW